MWFLQNGTLLKIALMCFVMALANAPLFRIRPGARKVLLLALNVLVVLLTDARLIAFYSVYSAVIYAAALLLPKLSSAKRAGFVFALFLCVLPFLFFRFNNAFEVAGIAYAALRAADAVFYAYYTGERVGFLPFFNFMLFTPVFTSGPIFRYRDFSKCLNDMAPVSVAVVSEAVKRVIRGMFKKVVLAQVLAQIFAHYLKCPYTFPVSLTLIFCGYFMLYCDLSGYSDIAAALGRLCGFAVPENFKSPWRAASFTAFWRSWHATLSDFIREHIFILLAKKKLNRVKSALIAAVTMLVMGLWHGFSAAYAAAGLYNGVLLAAENLLGQTSPKRSRGLARAARCFFVNFMFGVNALAFFTGLDNILAIASGLFKL